MEDKIFSLVAVNGRLLQLAELNRTYQFFPTLEGAQYGVSPEHSLYRLIARKLVDQILEDKEFKDQLIEGVKKKVTAEEVGLVVLGEMRNRIINSLFPTKD